MRFVLAMLAVLAVAGCEAFEPHVFVADEFDRTRPDFGERPDDVARVVVCYNRASATPEAVAGLARDRCAAYGKAARFRDHDYRRCPLATPAGAVYDCAVP